MFGRKRGVVLGLLVSLASSGLKVSYSRPWSCQSGWTAPPFSGQLFTIGAGGDVGSEIKKEGGKRERKTERQRERDRKQRKKEREKKKQKERERQTDLERKKEKEKRKRERGVRPC